MAGELPDVTLGDGAVVVAPSGQEVRLQDVIWHSEGPHGPVARFRFLAPAIAREGGTIGFDLAAGDMLHLCQSLAVPMMQDMGDTRGFVVISLADRIVEFGVTDPDATQFFESFSTDGATCTWEEY